MHYWGGHTNSKGVVFSDAQSLDECHDFFEAYHTLGKKTKNSPQRFVIGYTVKHRTQIDLDAKMIESRFLYPSGRTKVTLPQPSLFIGHQAESYALSIIPCDVSLDTKIERDVKLFI